MYTIAQSAKTNAISQYITSLKNDSLLRSASMSILVIDAKSKEIIASHQPQTALISASTSKLVTTGLSLIALGSEYNYQTSLWHDGNINDSTLTGNLYIVGGGDPTFASSEPIATPINTIFAQWATVLKNKGIKRIDGKIIADETFFAQEEIPESWSWGDIGNYYGARPSGLPFHENSYLVQLSSSKKEGDTAIIQRLYPIIPNADFVNTITTGKRNSGNTATIYNSPYSNKHFFTGTIPPQRDSVVIKGSNNSAAHTCIWHFSNYLNQQNIRFDGELEIRSKPYSASEEKVFLASHNSPSLLEIAAVTNKKSNNFYAETLLKTISLQKTKNSSFDSSLVAINYLLDSLNISRDGLQIRDGSGLSRKNYLSAQFLSDFLYAMYRSPVYEDYFYTMAVPGDKGTFEKLLQSVPTKNRLHAKSGSMEGVRAYAGYSENPNETIIFAIIINNFNYKISELQPKVEKLLQLITEY